MKTRSLQYDRPPIAVHDEPCDVGNFEIAGGRVVGAEHRRTDRACQDAVHWVHTDQALIAAVCDGCGSGRHSEVGAALGVRLWTQAVAEIVRQCPEPRRTRELDAASAAGVVSEPDCDSWTWSDVWRMTRERVCATLAQLVMAMGQPFGDTVADYFLFTVVSAAITPNTTAIHAIGDGVVSLNDRVDVIGPFPGNQPPYLAYDLLSRDGEIPLASSEFHRVVDTRDVESVILASDGATELEGDIGGLGQFVGDRYFRNRDALRRRLAVVNRETCDIDWRRGKVRRTRGALADDTAVIAIRRSAGARDGGLESPRLAPAGGRR